MGVDPQSLNRYSHRRLNPLTGEWVLVSGQRTKRPWQGQVDAAPRPALVDYDPACYLCPGNERAGGRRNPPYESTFVFDNDFPALMPDIPGVEEHRNPLMTALAERGLSRVVCFSPNHGLTLPRMTQSDVVKVVETWTGQYAEIGAMPFIRYVQIFENRGEMMGASNPHPHGQIWAAESIPDHVAKEDARQREWSKSRQSCLLCDYLQLETGGPRLVCENRSFVALVPFWAVWPFETMILSRRHFGGMDDMGAAEREDLADILRRLTTRYDNLFEAPFPYTMGFHQRPAGGESREWWHFHAHHYPPLLRSATVRKFMVGFELLGTPQRDITAESAAERLRACSEIHYLEK